MRFIVLGTLLLCWTSFLHASKEENPDERTSRQSGPIIVFLDRSSTIEQPPFDPIQLMANVRKMNVILKACDGKPSDAEVMEIARLLGVTGALPTSSVSPEHKK